MLLKRYAIVEPLLLLEDLLYLCVKLHSEEVDHEENV